MRLAPAAAFTKAESLLGGKRGKANPTSCQLWDEGNMVLQHPFMSLLHVFFFPVFCIKYALALNLVHYCPSLGQEFKFSCVAENNSPVLDIDLTNMPVCAKGT